LRFTLGYTQPSGTTLLSGGSLASDSTIYLNGGLMAGAGTIAAPVVNGAEIRPGASPGTITISGNYTQTTSGVLTVEIGGRTGGTEYDRLVVTGSATLDGVVNVTFISGFVPNVTDTFEVLRYGSRIGSFAAYNGLGFGGGRR